MSFGTGTNLVIAYRPFRLAGSWGDMERIDYSWDDQDPEQTQSWHETNGFRLNNADAELPANKNQDLEAGDSEEDSSDYLTGNTLENFNQWLEEHFTALELDILLTMPVDRYPGLSKNHSDVARLMKTHDITFQDLRYENQRLRISVLEKLREQGLDWEIPWRV